MTVRSYKFVIKRVSLRTLTLFKPTDCHFTCHTTAAIYPLAACSQRHTEGYWICPGPTEAFGSDEGEQRWLVICASHVQPTRSALCVSPRPIHCSVGTMGLVQKPQLVGHRCLKAVSKCKYTHLQKSSLCQFIC